MAWEPNSGETPIDPSHLKVAGVTTRSQLNIIEAENIRHAVMKYLAVTPTRRIAKSDYGWVLKLHSEMFGNVWTWAGQLRHSDGHNIGITWHAVPEALATLLDDLPAWSEFGMDVVEQATRLHHRAVQIHPFCNGNGRWSRMLANIWLRLHDHPLIQWPESVIGEESPIRQQYIHAMRIADQGDFQPLLQLHRQFVEAGRE
ncbi:MAG: mobile mystery protein B [Planctomycetaceae bacterium]